MDWGMQASENLFGFESSQPIYIISPLFSIGNPAGGYFTIRSNIRERHYSPMAAVTRIPRLSR